MATILEKEKSRIKSASASHSRQRRRFGDPTSMIGGFGGNRSLMRRKNTLRPINGQSNPRKICHEPELISVSSLDVYNIGALPQF